MFQVEIWMVSCDLAWVFLCSLAVTLFSEGALFRTFLVKSVDLARISAEKCTAVMPRTLSGSF